MHILVVEDEQRLAYLLRRVLLEERHTVDLANDGPVVVVLDEFQYILGSNEVTSHLVAAWDPAPKNRPITSNILKVHQDSVFRMRKYCVSSGMFAYQMSMYWPKPM